MDKKLFSALLKKPALLQETHFSVLQEYSRQYPFAAIFYQLLAKKAFTEKPYEFDTYLSKAAIYSLDRKKLYEIIHAIALAVEDNLDESTNVSPVNIQQEEEKIALVANNNLVEENNFSHTIEQAIPFINGNFSESSNNNNVSKTEEISIDETNVKENKTAKKAAKKKPKKEFKKTKKQIENDTAIDISKTALSFTDWLKYINKNKLVDTTKSQATQEPNTNDDLAEQYHAGQFEAKLHEEIKTLPENPNTINVPKIPTNWRKNVSEEGEIKISHLAQKSLEKTEHNITETFAKILELQKKYDAAIDAYEKLSLKYPEKSSFFAVRILEIKNKMQ